MKKVLFFLLAFVLMTSLAVASCARPAVKEEERPVIKVGIICAMTFIPGIEQWRGASLAAEEINAAGGVNVGGVMHRIELIKADSNELLSVPDAVTAMEKLVTFDKADFIAGTVRTEAALAMQEIAMDHKVMFDSLGSAHPQFTSRVAEDYDRYKYTFRTGSANAAYQGKLIFALADTIARKVREELEVEKPRVALLFEKAVWNEPIIEAAKPTLPALGMEMVGVWRPSAMAADVTAELSAIKAADAHIIFCCAAGPVDTTISKQWYELKIPAITTGTSCELPSGAQWKDSRGACQYRTVLSLSGRVEITEKAMPFWDAHIKKFGEIPGVYSAGAYDYIYILKEAIERAGTLDSDAVVAEFEKTDYLGAQGRVVYGKKLVPGVEYPHDKMWGPEYGSGFGVQWIDGELRVFWPDGQPVLGDTRWKGIRYVGTHDVQLPPWMIEYWKGK